MANTRKNNVLVIDTAAQLNEALHIIGVKVVNGGQAPASSTIKVGGSTGTTIYTSSVEGGEEKYEEVCIHLKTSDQAYITPGADCVVYVYLK